MRGSLVLSYHSSTRSRWHRSPSIILLSLLFLSASVPSEAQPPDSFAGTAVAGSVTAGTGPFASSGYFLLVPSDSGPNYQVIGIYGVADFNGTYFYNASGAYGVLNLNTPSGSQVLDLDFITPSGGTFFWSAAPAYQQGNFEWASGSAPASISGAGIYLTAEQGAGRFPTSGSALFKASAADDTYTLDGSAGGSQQHSTGTYAYSKLNTSVGSVQLKDPANGTSTLYVVFADSASGPYAIRQPVTGGFQLGNFSLLKTSVGIIEPTSAAAYTASTNTVTLRGIAGDTLGISQVTWRNNRGGADTAVGTTNWSAAGIPLQIGLNVITVTALDTVGNSAHAVLTVSYTPRTALSVVRQGTNVVLSWPTTVAGFGVESATNLVSGGWNTNYPLPVIANGFYVVTNPITRPAKVYRLIKP